MPARTQSVIKANTIVFITNLPCGGGMDNIIIVVVHRCQENWGARSMIAVIWNTGARNYSSVRWRGWPVRTINLETKCHAISFAESSAMSAILSGPPAALCVPGEAAGAP
jgi:hypothetical protein